MWKSIKYIFCFFIFTELALQLLSLVVKEEFPRRSKSQISIAAIGESTTKGNGKEPYTTFLQEKLDQKYGQGKVRVYNLGQTGASSKQILEQFDEILVQYEPDIFITMMGINDQFLYVDTEARWLPLDVQTILLNFKTYRFFKLIHYNVFLRNQSTGLSNWEVNQKLRLQIKEMDDQFQEKYGASLQRHLYDEKEAFTPELEREALKILSFIQSQALGQDDRKVVSLKHQDSYWIYATVFRNVFDAYFEQERMQELVPLSERAVKLHPRSLYFHTFLVQAYEAVGDLEKLRVAHKKIEKLRNGFRRVAKYQNYRAYAQKIRRAKRRHIAMTYPMRKLEALVEGLVGLPGITYVENQENFKKKIAETSFRTVFNDRFAGDFGHCEAVGNQLIVENLWPAVDQMVGSLLKEVEVK